tara:strand:+ start:11816 stop:13867 length:2052 start_codon:yes stop_codon:yes gene_type:complete
MNSQITLSGEDIIQANEIDFPINSFFYIGGVAPVNKVLSTDADGHLVYGNNDFSANSIRNDGATISQQLTCFTTKIDVLGNLNFLNTTPLTIQGTFVNDTFLGIKGGIMNWYSPSLLSSSKIELLDGSGNVLSKVECGATNISLDGTLQLVDNVPFIIGTDSGNPYKVLGIKSDGTMEWVFVNSQILSTDNLVINSALINGINPNYLSDELGLKIEKSFQVDGVSYIKQLDLIGNKSIMINGVNGGINQVLTTIDNTGQVGFRNVLLYTGGTNINVVSGVVNLDATITLERVNVKQIDLQLSPRITINGVQGLNNQILVSDADGLIRWANQASGGGGGISYSAGTNITISGPSPQAISVIENPIFNTSVSTPLITSTTINNSAVITTSTLNATTIINSPFIDASIRLIAGQVDTDVLNATSSFIGQANQDDCLTTGTTETNILDFKTINGITPKIKINGVLGDGYERQFLSLDPTGQVIYDNPWEVVNKFRYNQKTRYENFQGTTIASWGPDLTTTPWSPNVLVGFGSTGFNFWGFFDINYTIAIPPPTTTINFTRVIRFQYPIIYAVGGFRSGGAIGLLSSEYKMTGVIRLFTATAGSSSVIPISPDDNVQYIVVGKGALAGYEFSFFDFSRGMEITLLYHGSSNEVEVDIKIYGVNATTGTFANWKDNGAIVCGTGMIGYN